MSAIEYRDVAGAARAFWQWWLAELAGMVPAQLQPSGRGQTRVEIWPSAQEVRIDRTTATQGERFVESQPLEALDAESWSQLATLTADAWVALILSPPDVFVTSVTLPKSARSHLVSAVGLQLLELAPMDPQLLTWAIGRAAAVGDTLVVKVAMARSERLMAIQVLFEAQSLAGPPILAAVDEGNLQLVGGTGTAGTSLSPSAKRSLLVAALLAISPVVTLVAAKALTAASIERFDTLQAETSAKQAALRKARQAAVLREALAPMLATPPATVLHALLAEKVPDSAYALSLERTAAGALSLRFSSSDVETLDAALLGSAELPPLRKVDETPGDDGRMQVRYEQRRR